MPLRGLSLSIEVLLKMTNRMNKKTTTSLPRLIRGRMSMNLGKYTPSMRHPKYWVPFRSLFVSEVAPELVDCTRITYYHLPDVEQIDSKGKV